MSVRITCAAWILGVVCSATSIASAQPRVSLGTFEGPKAKELKDEVVRLLAPRDEIELVEITTEPKRSGVASVLAGSVVRADGLWKLQLVVEHTETRRKTTRVIAAPMLEAVRPKLSTELWSSVGALLVEAPPPVMPRTIGLWVSGGKPSAMQRLERELEQVGWLSIRSIEGVPNSPAARRGIARAKGVDALVSLSLSRRRGRSFASGTVFGEQGEFPYRTEPNRRLAGVAQSLAQAWKTALDQAVPMPKVKVVQAPVARKPSPQATLQPPARVEAPAAKKSDPNGLGIKLRAKLGFGGRNFGYQNERSGGLRPYALDAAPILHVGGGYYPWGESLIVSPGLEVSGFYMLGVSSSDPTGGSLGTQAFGGELAIRGQTQLQSLSLGLRAGLGYDAFLIDTSEDSAAFPSTEYTYFRPALDAAYQFGRIKVGAQLGYRFGLGSGEVGSEAWFPNASVGAFDVDGFLGYEILSSLLLTAEAGLVQYSASLDAPPDGFPSAESYSDTRWNLGLGVQWQL